MFRDNFDYSAEEARGLIAADGREQIDRVSLQAEKERLAQQLSSGLDAYWLGSNVEKMMHSLADELGSRVLFSGEFPAYVNHSDAKLNIPRPIREGARYRDVDRGFTKLYDDGVLALRGGLVMYRDLDTPEKRERGFYCFLAQYARFDVDTLTPLLLAYGELPTDTDFRFTDGDRLFIESILAGERSEDGIDKDYLTSLLAYSSVKKWLRKRKIEHGVLVQNKGKIIESVDEEFSDVYDAAFDFFAKNYSPRTYSDSFSQELLQSAKTANAVHELAGSESIVSEFDVARVILRRREILDQQQERAVSDVDITVCEPEDNGVWSQTWQDFMPRLLDYPGPREFFEQRRLTAEKPDTDDDLSKIKHYLLYLMDDNHSESASSYHSWWAAQDPRPELTLDPSLFPFD